MWLRFRSLSWEFCGLKIHRLRLNSLVSCTRATCWWCELWQNSGRLGHRLHPCWASDWSSSFHWGHRLRNSEASPSDLVYGGPARQTSINFLSQSNVQRCTSSDQSRTRGGSDYRRKVGFLKLQRGNLLRAGMSSLGPKAQAELRGADGTRVLQRLPRMVRGRNSDSHWVR